MSEALETLKAILREKLPEGEVQAFMAELTIASGDGSVAIDGNATEAVIVTGSQHVVGDNNRVVINQGTDPEEITKMLHNLLRMVQPQNVYTGNIYQLLDPETINRIVREEVRLPQRKYGDSVSSGLNALSELMQNAEARSAVTTFRVDFQAACEQINIIANYKKLHDLLHNLEFSCYNTIIQESKRFPDEEVVNNLIDHELTLQEILRDIQEVAGRETIAISEVMWLKDLERAQTELHGAIEDLDNRQLQRTIWLLNRILAIQPSRINTNLNSAARTMRLPALVSAMKHIWETLAESNLNQEKLKQFGNGVDMLAELNQRLAALVLRHDFWQEMDLELRRIEANLEKDLIELEMSWTDLKERTEVLFNSAGDKWTIDFQQDSQDLDAALNAHNPVKIKHCFRKYRRRASKRFYEVDATLKRLCEELREVGEPLASVLRIIE